MSRDLEQVRAEPKAAVFQSIASLGEKETRRITEECLGKAAEDHYGRR